MTPLVSIILTSYNKSAYITATIQSILAQSYSNFELLIYDDASTDSSISCIEPFLNDKRVQLFRSEVNKGANYQRNLGLQNSKGDYLMIMDADDLLATTCLENRVKIIAGNPQASGVVFTLACFFKAPGDSDVLWQAKTSTPLKDFLQHKLPWQTMQVLWRSKQIKHKSFDLDFERLQDVDFHTNVLLDVNLSVVQHGGAPDCFFRIDETRLTSSSYNFMLKWVRASIQYFQKYGNRVEANLRKYLNGTLFHAHLQLLLRSRKNELTAAQLSELEQLLLHSPDLKLNITTKCILGISKLYNLYCFRIKGFNVLLHKLVVTF